jgi:tetratricopeptide (TPR) repeat protein
VGETGGMTDWQDRADTLWERFDEWEPSAFVREMKELVAELPTGSALGAFELGGAYDSTGRTAEAVEQYRLALAPAPPATALRTDDAPDADSSAGAGAGAADDGVGAIDPSQRRQAVIQLASSLRALGEVEQSVELLTAERAETSDELDDAVTGFLALALVHAGREREAAALALGALAAHLPRYRRSLTAYAAEL